MAGLLCGTKRKKQGSGDLFVFFNGYLDCCRALVRNFRERNGDASVYLTLCRCYLAAEVTVSTPVKAFLSCRWVWGMDSASRFIERWNGTFKERSSSEEDETGSTFDAGDRLDLLHVGRYWDHEILQLYRYRGGESLYNCILSNVWDNNIILVFYNM